MPASSRPLWKQYRAAGGKVEKQWDYGTDKELTDLLAEVRKIQTGAVVFVGPAADFSRLRAARRDTDAPLLFGGEETAPDVLVPDGKPARMPVFRVTAFAIDKSLPQTNEFADKYQGRFKRLPDAPAALAYDSARVLFDAMRRAGGFQAAKVREELLNTKDFESVTGPLSFDKDQNARRPVLVVRVENGREKLEKCYDPEPAAARVLPRRFRRGTLLHEEMDGELMSDAPPVSRRHP